MVKCLDRAIYSCLGTLFCATLSVSTIPNITRAPGEQHQYHNSTVITVS